MYLYWRSFVVLALLAAIHRVTNAQKNAKILSVSGIAGSKASVPVRRWAENNHYTFCMWINVDENYRGSIFAPAYQRNFRHIIGPALHVYPEENRIRFNLYPYEFYNNNYGYCLPRSWFHLCSLFVINGISRIYVNGVQAPIPKDTANTTGNLIRQFPEGESFNVNFVYGKLKGMFYNVNIWNFLLSDQDILKLANCKSKIEGNHISWTFLTKNLKLEGAKFINGTGPCTDPITRTDFEHLDNKRNLTTNPVKCKASTQTLSTTPVPATTQTPATMRSLMTTPTPRSIQTTSNPKISSSNSLPGTSFSLQTKGSSQSFSSRSRSTSRQPDGLSQPLLSGCRSVSRQPDGKSQPISYKNRRVSRKSDGKSQPISYENRRVSRKSDGLSQSLSYGSRRFLRQRDDLSQPFSSGRRSFSQQPDGKSQPISYGNRISLRQPAGVSQPLSYGSRRFLRQRDDLAQPFSSGRRSFSQQADDLSSILFSGSEILDSIWQFISEVFSITNPGSSNALTSNAFDYDEFDNGN